MNLRKRVSAWLYDERILLGEQFNFGHREILLACNKLDPTSLIRASIPHGWGEGTNSHDYPRYYRKFGKVYPLLSWSDRATESYKSKGHRNVLTTGSPWAHLLNATNQNNASRQKRFEKKVLYFPSHSIPGGTVDHYQNKLFLQNLSKLGDVTVCLFWLDFVDPITLSFFKKFGFDVKCVGYKGSAGFDSPWTPVGGRVSFLTNLLDLLNCADLVVLDSVSTTFWYALSLKKTVLLSTDLGESTWWGGSSPINILNSNRQILRKVDDSLIELDLDRPIEISNDLYMFALQEIGYGQINNFKEFIHNSKALRKNIIDSSILAPITDYLNKNSVLNDDSAT